MVVKKITRKVISKAPEDAVKKEEVEQEVQKPFRVKKFAFFVKAKFHPLIRICKPLGRYLSDRSKIVPKLKSSVCSKHQRAVSRQIKYARHLSLLPFIPKV